MRRRHSLLYLLVLLILGGYYYYFEVLGEQRKHADERQARRIFHVQADAIDTLAIESKDKQSVHLSKEDDWRIVAPINGEVDRATLDGLLSTLATLEAERRLSDPPQDLTPFGLVDPALQITFRAGTETRKLAVGAQNPAGDSYYAKTDDATEIFLLPQGVRGILDKGVDGLRRRELMNFDPSAVRRVAVDWLDGRKVLVERSSEQEWTVPGHPEIELKSSKVANLLDQLQWLRAEKFLADGVDKLARYGLQPPQATVTVDLAKDRSVDLRLGKTADQGKGVAATGSQLPAVVMVRADIFKDLPDTVESLQERSLLTLDKDQIARVKWRLGEEQGEVLRLEENKWGWRRPGKPPQELEESWRVSALAYDLGQAEYTKELKPAPQVPEKAAGSLEFFSENEKLAGILWLRGDDDRSGKRGTFWVEQNGRPLLAVEGDSELVDRIEEDLREFLRGRPAEDPSP